MDVDRLSFAHPFAAQSSPDSGVSLWNDRRLWAGEVEQSSAQLPLAEPVTSLGIHGMGYHQPTQYIPHFPRSPTVNTPPDTLSASTIFLNRSPTTEPWLASPVSAINATPPRSLLHFRYLLPIDFPPHEDSVHAELFPLLVAHFSFLPASVFLDPLFMLQILRTKSSELSHSWDTEEMPTMFSYAYVAHNTEIGTDPQLALASIPIVLTRFGVSAPRETHLGRASGIPDGLASAVRAYRLRRAWGCPVIDPGAVTPPKSTESWQHGHCAELQAIPPVVEWCEHLQLENVVIHSLSVHKYGTRSAAMCKHNPWLTYDGIVLRSEIADGAMHDSAERSSPPMCHAETRKAVQEDIFSWIAHEDRDADRPKTVLWMSGPAGCGKTAIAGSVAEICEERGILAASFFFSSFSASQRRRRKRFLIPTLAYQLMQADVTGRVREHISSSIRRDPAILRKALKYQCRTLLLKPFIDNPPQTHIKVIVIDGLDEVESELPGGPLGEITRLQILRANQDDQVEILEALLPIVTNPAFPFRLFLVSRPERAIREFFTSQTAIQVTHELFLDGKYNPDADIELFLRSKFSDIRRRYRLPGSWPADESIETLVSNASGQFVYATTIIRFVEDGTRTPPDQLVRALRMQSMGTDNPLEPLFALYQHILDQSPDPTFASHWILLAAGLHYFRLPDMPARYCRLLLETSPGQEELLFGELVFVGLHPGIRRHFIALPSVPQVSWDYLRSIIGPRVLQEVRCRCYIRILENKGPVVPIVPICQFDKKVRQFEVRDRRRIELRLQYGSQIIECCS
ncbi:hypothetical protein NMY22_g5027 [Coprinellus aureogranulatus]|nr:hypothetical protein NMY22_g5027 [Coprinellus aureogranulatus]